MSLPASPYPAVPAAHRIVGLVARNRCVELDTILGGQVLHTGFGYGPEFWLLAPGMDADTSPFDFVRAEIAGARLIIQDNTPVTAPDALLKRGVSITSRIPRI